MQHASMLDIMGEDPVASPGPTEEALLWGWDPEPKEDQATALHTPIQPEKACEPEDAIGSRVIAAVPQKGKRQVPPPPLEFS